MKIVKVNSISLVEKDVIELADLEGFEAVKERFFESTMVFDLKGTLYLIGKEVAYTFRTK